MRASDILGTTVLLGTVHVLQASLLVGLAIDVAGILVVLSD